MSILEYIEHELSQIEARKQQAIQNAQTECDALEGERRALEKMKRSLVPPKPEPPPPTETESPADG